MNERIKELANEAAKFSAIMALPTGEMGNKLFVEKFAELIVRECIDLVKIKTNNDQLFADKTYQRGYLDGRADSAFMIKEHFGVEDV